MPYATDSNHLKARVSSAYQLWCSCLQEVIDEASYHQEVLSTAEAMRAKHHLLQNSLIERLKPESDCMTLERFNVGGTFHTISKNILCSYPESKLCQLVHNTNCARDRDHRLLIDRDGETFGHVLNVLRGKKAQSVRPHSAMVEDDLRYYGPFSPQLAVPENFGNSNLFCNPLSAGSLSARATFCVGYVNGSSVQGCNVVRFRMDRCAYVGVGVVSDSCSELDVEFHKSPLCCVYYMTGVLYTNFVNHMKEEGHQRFFTNDVISISLNMDKKVIKFMNGDRIVRIIDCQSASRLRFAVVVKFESVVTILDPE